MQTVGEALHEFHTKYGLVSNSDPISHRVDTELWKLRNNLHCEEFAELQEAMGALWNAETQEEHEETLIQLADAVCDLTYVIVGSCESFGIPFDRCFAEVQRSNMSKLGEDGKPIVREEDGKILKGPFFSPPNLARIIFGARAETPSR